ncbi:hypothetical protein B5G50_08220 [Brevibacillus brevis]|nr:hypothetical protein B5G50_08220 [Brevibacillus brevis]
MVLPVTRLAIALKDLMQGRVACPGSFIPAKPPNLGGFLNLISLLLSSYNFTRKSKVNFTVYTINATMQFVFRTFSKEVRPMKKFLAVVFAAAMVMSVASSALAVEPQCVVLHCQWAK